MNGEINWIAVQPLIGGMSIGFENGFNSTPKAIITSGIKNDDHYINYMNNKRKLNIPIIYMNSSYDEFLSETDENLYNDIILKYDIDVVQHLAICSGLSMLNTCNSGNKARGNPDNVQNQNMYNLTKLGMKIGAKVVVFENAPTAYTKSGENVIKYLKNIAEQFNYTTHLLKTDTILHGIPQSRKRTFIMFYKNVNPPLFNFEHIKYIELSKYLNLLDKNLNHYSDYVFKKINDIYYEFILDYSQSNTYFDAMKKIGPHKDTWTALQLTQHIGFDKAISYFKKRLAYCNDVEKLKYEKGIKFSEHCLMKLSKNMGYWDASSYIANNGLFINAVISKNIHRAIHPTEERTYNIRELLWLMGMPNDFDVIEQFKNWYHISQNVPVNTATYIAKQIKLFLCGKLQLSNTNFVKQDNIKQKNDIGSIAYNTW